MRSIVPVAAARLAATTAQAQTPQPNGPFPLASVTDRMHSGPLGDGLGPSTLAPLRPLLAPVRRSGNAMSRTSALLFPLLLIGACVPSGHLLRERAPTPAFDPILFFAGHTRGVGSLKVMTKKRQTVVVEGHGVSNPDGTFVLTQYVRRGNRPVVHRTWHLRRIAPGRFAGTLSDAVGPVAGDTFGNTLHLTFRMKGGLRAQQWLELQPGGQVSHNRLIVTKLGMPVASLDETITRIPQG